MSVKSKRKKRIILFCVFLLCLAITCVFLTKLIGEQIYPLKYTEYVEKYAEEYQVDPSFIYAVIHSESRFDPKAVSSVGASGLMQLMPDTFDWIKSRLKDDRVLSYEKDVFDPQINIQYGTYMLSMLLDEFQDRDVAVMAYHAGRGNVSKWLKNEKYSADGKTIHTIPYRDTATYVSHVNSAYWVYTKLYKNESGYTSDSNRKDF